MAITIRIFNYFVSEMLKIKSILGNLRSRKRFLKVMQSTWPGGPMSIAWRRTSTCSPAAMDWMPTV